MPNITPASIYIPSGQEVEKAARKAMDNIAKQLKKMPPVPKAPSAADNFPGIYNNPADFKPHILGKTETGKTIIKKLNSDFAIDVYKNAG